MEEIRGGRASSRVLADGRPARDDRPRRGYGELITRQWIGLADCEPGQATTRGR
jgi:hypothetical protein